MQYAHNIKIKVFCKEKDNPEELKISLLSLLPFEDDELEKEKIGLEEEELAFDDGSRIRIFSVFLSKQRHVRKVLEHIFGLLDEDQKEFLLETLDSRLDESMNLFFRLDKDKLNIGECELTDSGNCFHFRVNIAAYPNKVEIARKIAREMIENSKNKGKIINTTNK